MLRSSFGLGLLATAMAPQANGAGIAAHLRLMEHTKTIDIRHQQEQPGIMRFSFYDVTDILVIANRRRVVTDRSAVDRVVASLKASRPTPSVNGFECFWAIRFLDARGKPLEIIALDDDGKRGALGTSPVAFARLDFLRELASLLPNRPLTDNDRHSHILMPRERPGEHS